MLKQTFLLSLLIHHAFPDCQCGLRTQLGRIIGGKDAQPGQYPWQTFIMIFDDDIMQGYNICGGSIINTEWILTAAHCLPSSSTINNQVVQRDILVRVGRVSNADLDVVFQPWINYRLNIGPRPEMSTLNENGLFLVDRWVSHNEFPETYSADIALLHVQTPFKFSITTRPVCLETPSAGQQFHPVVELSGWGQTSDNSSESDRLQGVKVGQVEYEDCSIKNEVNSLREMCFTSGRLGGCYGDSGSPYVVENSGRFFQIAIESRSRSQTCEVNSTERIGIRVAYFYNWIKKMANSGTWYNP